jgi:hypothetical protein
MKHGKAGGLGLRDYSIDMLELYIQEPTIRTGHRAELMNETYSYYLSVSSKKIPTHMQREIAYCAMEWAYRVLPHNTRICDAHLLPAPHSSNSKLLMKAQELGVTLFPHMASPGTAIHASTSTRLIDFILEVVGNDDDLYVRPMDLSQIPDSQPWMIRSQKNYIEMATDRYGAVLLFCLSPISFEIVSSKPIAELVSTTAYKISEQRKIILTPKK